MTASPWVVMPKFFLLFLLSVLFFSPSAHAEEDMYTECDSYRDVPVHVTPRFDEPVFDFTASIGDIMALSRDLHHSIQESLTLGLTRYEPMLELQVPVRGVKLPNGLACVHVDHVDVTFGYQNVKVYVAREFPQGSCGFNEVLAHEQKHINVNKKILNMYAPRIAQELGDYLKLNGVFRELDEDYAMGILHEKLQSVINGIVKDLNKENTYRQRDVDTYFEYQRVSESCNGEVQRVTSKYRMKMPH
jgi:hypothetical protein